MLISRSIPIIRSYLFKNQQINVKQAARNSSHDHQWMYRSGNTNVPKHIIYMAEFVQGFFWWWVLWHLWTEPGHVIGDFEYPDSSKWTDEELGIPPDEE